MSLSREFTNHYQSMEPEVEIIEPETPASHWPTQIELSPSRRAARERGKVLSFPVVPQVWSELRMEAQ